MAIHKFQNLFVEKMNKSDIKQEIDFLKKSIKLEKEAIRDNLRKIKKSKADITAYYKLLRKK